MTKLKDEDLRLNVIINGDNARKEMGKLERSIADTEIKIQSLLIKQKEMKAANQGSSKAYQDLSKEIQININKNKESKIKLDTLSRSQKLGTMTVKDLRRNIKLLNEELSKTDPNSKQWDVVNSKLKVTKSRLAELTAQSKATTGVLKNMSTRFNDYAGMAAASVASFAFVVTGINKCRTSFAEYDETLVDTMKTTNLSREDVEKLSKSLSNLNTRTAQNELLNLARVGGKLGITNLTKIEEFVRAADVINVALSEDLGGNAEDAIREIGKLVDIFKIEDEFGLEKGMLKIASAINDLGMASTANEGYLVSFSKRVAGIAPNADISIQDVLGLAGTLDSLGQMAETAGTAYGQAITGMYQDTESFAKVAGMTEVAFEKLLEVDANEAFVRVLEGMNASEVGMRGVLEAMDSLSFDGQQVVQVLGSLASQTDELRRQQDIASESFATGTSAMDEFDKKNNSVTATIEKNKKALEAQAVILGEKLNPLINFSVSSFTYFVKILGATITFTTKYSGVLIALTAVILAMNAQATYSNTLAKIRNFWTIANTATTYKDIVALRTATVSTSLFAAAKALLTGNIKLATFAMKRFWVAMGPIGWAVLAIGGLTSAYLLLKDRVSDVTAETLKLNEAQEKGAKEYNDKAEKIQALSNIINDNTASVTARRRAIEDIKTAGVEYNGSLNDEYVLTNNNTEAIKAYLTQLNKKLQLEALDVDLRKAQALRDKTKNKLDLYVDELDKTEEHNKSQMQSYTINGNLIKSDTKDTREFEKNIAEASKTLALIDSTIADLNKKMTELEPIVPPKTDWSLNTDKDFVKASLLLSEQLQQGEIKSQDDYNEKLLELELATIKQRLALKVDEGDSLIKLESELNSKLLKQSKQGDDDAKGGKVTDTTAKWSLSSDEKYLKSRLALKKQYEQGEIISDQEYKKRLLELEVTSIQERLTLNIEQGIDRTKLEENLTDKLLEQKKQQQRDTEAVNKLIIGSEDDKTKQELSRYEAEKKKYAGNNAALEALESIHLRNMATITLDSMNDKIKRIEEGYNLDRELILKRHQEEISTFKGSKNEKKQIHARHNKEVQNLDKEHFNELSKLLQDFFTTGNFEGIEIEKELLSDEEYTRLLNKFTDLQKALSALGLTAKDIGYSMINPEGDGSLFGISQSDWEQFFKNIKEGELGWDDLAFATIAAKEVILATMTASDNIQRTKENNQLKDFKKNNDKKEKILSDRLKAGLITQEQHDAEVQVLEDEYNVKKEEIEIAQAKRKKKSDIASAIMNTAVGVTKTIAEWGLPWGLIPAGIVAAMGATEIALISSTPIVAGAEDGGSIFERAQDGKQFNAKLSPDKRGFISKPTILVGENGSEYVIPNEGIGNPTLAPFIATIERARKNGSLKSLDFRSIYPVDSVVGRELGGFTQPTNVPAPQKQVIDISDNSIVLDKLLQVVEQLERILSNPTRAYVTMLGDGGILEAIKKHERLKKRGTL